MSEKIYKIAELLGVTYLSKNTQSIVHHTLKSMVEAIKNDNEKLYNANYKDLMQHLGVNRLVDNRMLTETELHDLSDKIFIMLEVAAAKKLYEMYFPKAASKNTKRIDKNQFNWRQ
jgi:hypothetical protein